MGIVYKARQRTLDRLVALKVMPPDVARDPGFAERFTREARTLARLQHPNIVAIHDFGTSDGLYFLLMEYVDGANLRQAIRSGALTASQALAIVPQICDALQYAHENGVVHRDVKPENILLDRAGRVRIADFGLAKIVQRTPVDVTLTRAGQVMGTLHYMAPEQYRTPDAVDHRADIYSLGVVFYEMLVSCQWVGSNHPRTGRACGRWMSGWTRCASGVGPTSLNVGAQLSSQQASESAATDVERIAFGAVGRTRCRGEAQLNRGITNRATDGSSVSRVQAAGAPFGVPPGSCAGTPVVSSATWPPSMEALGGRPSFDSMRPDAAVTWGFPGLAPWFKGSLARCRGADDHRLAATQGAPLLPLVVGGSDCVDGPRRGCPPGALWRTWVPSGDLWVVHAGTAGMPVGCMGAGVRSKGRSGRAFRGRGAALGERVNYRCAKANQAVVCR